MGKLVRTIVNLNGRIARTIVVRILYVIKIVRISKVNVLGAVMIGAGCVMKTVYNAVVQGLEADRIVFMLIMSFEFARFLELLILGLEVK